MRPFAAVAQARRSGIARPLNIYRVERFLQKDAESELTVVVAELDLPRHESFDLGDRFMLEAVVQQCDFAVSQRRTMRCPIVLFGHRYLHWICLRVVPLEG